MLEYIKDVLVNMPDGWLITTTHRLDIYNEKLAKVEFLDHFENLYKDNVSDTQSLDSLPTAYDYIRLGHPLSCVLEWGVAKLNNIDSKNAISFSSKTTPILAVLRKNLLQNKNTQINYTGALPDWFDTDTIRKVYGYEFELNEVAHIDEISDFDGSTIFISEKNKVGAVQLQSAVDFFIEIYDDLGSLLIVNGQKSVDYISDIQHVRRRETIAMTPVNCVKALESLTRDAIIDNYETSFAANKSKVLTTIEEITKSASKPLVGSSGLSIQYAIMMGLIDSAMEHHSGKAIKFIVPTNCYGGTNDQARRVAVCLDNVDVVDLAVDGDNDMVDSLEKVLTQIANQDAIPYIIAEIPTNPRVEVPDLYQLREVLRRNRKTASGELAVDPVFILDQTFCPNVHFLGEEEILSNTHTISYASGSKFPSGGRCTAGYCVSNKQASGLMDKIEKHLLICDNEATELQYEILAEQLPSMNQRIHDAYKNTRTFVDYIQEVLPTGKINFVSEALAEEGFTPSVFSLDLPTKGNTEEEKEIYKRTLNLKLINLMITKIPDESKFCVSYGQLKGCYWTIPATSTQGTTKEGDKDYIVRASLSPNMDIDLHKEVFLEFVNSIEPA